MPLWKKVFAFFIIIISSLTCSIYILGQPPEYETFYSSYGAYYNGKIGTCLTRLYSFGSKFKNSNLPYYIRYHEIRTGRLKDFLAKRNSLLAEEPYFSAILGTAKKYNLNPLILFAITGQEQNFVPKSEKYASKIANNPFNVFHSWKEYNTNIKDSSEIAARTIINLSENRPDTTDPFLWIGKKYAEDTHWGYGVRDIFKELEQEK